jgi:hypothetical protein
MHIISNLTMTTTIALLNIGGQEQHHYSEQNKSVMLTGTHIVGVLSTDPEGISEYCTISMCTTIVLLYLKESILHF